MAGIDGFFDYESLSVLEAVVRTGSFDQAARLIGVTQSAVSQRIRLLEERLGSVLIVRGRPCTPTDQGLLLCQHLEQVQLLQNEVSQRIGATHLSGRQKASVRIAVNVDSLATWFAEVVRRVESECNLRLDVVPDDQDYTEERLRNGDALGAVTTSERAVPGCTIVNLGEMLYAAVASPDYVRKYLGANPGLSEFERAPVIAFDRRDELPDSWIKGEFGKSPTLPRHIIPSYEGHLRCAQAGAGWAMMPTVTVDPLIRRGDLVDLNPKRRVRIALKWQSHAGWSQALRSLTDIVVGVAADWLEHPVQVTA